MGRKSRFNEEQVIRALEASEWLISSSRSTATWRTSAASLLRKPATSALPILKRTVGSERVRNGSRMRRRSSRRIPVARPHNAKARSEGEELLVL